MRASTAFFAGIGTVGLAITGGLGGGLMIGNMMNPSPPKHAAEAAQTERPTSPQPRAAASGLPYVAGTLAFTDPALNGKAPPTDQKADGSKASSPPPVATVASGEQAPKPPPHPAAGLPTQEAQQAPSAKQASAPEDAYAKAHDTDLKRAVDKRRAERAQRRSYDQAQDQDQYQNQKSNKYYDQQARDDRDRGNGAADYSYDYSSRVYRDDSRGRYRDAERDDDRAPPYYADEAPRFDFPRIQLFGPDD